MPGLLGERVEPHCPVCEGPCAHPFPRSPYVFPDRLPWTPRDSAARDPQPPKKPKKPNRRGKRLAKDMAIHGPERTTAIEGPGHDRARDDEAGVDR